MPPLTVFLLFLVMLVLPVAAVAAASHYRRRRARREWLEEAPFPAAWRAILRRNMPAYRRMPDTLRAALERKVKAFLSEKTFEACGGLRAVTDEMAVTIAGHACLAVVGRPGVSSYRRLSSVLVYPDSFFSASETREAGPEGVYSDSGEHRVGESDARGTVALSWLEIRNNIAFSGNGRNVVLHEFAHQLDAEDAAMDGAPAMSSPAEREALKRELTEAYAALREAGEHGVLDAYGAREPAELFAVAVEAFFEDAVRFREAHPALQAQLARYFGADPSVW